MSYVNYINNCYCFIQVWRIKDKIVKGVEGATSPGSPPYPWHHHPPAPPPPSSVLPPTPCRHTPNVTNPPPHRQHHPPAASPPSLICGIEAPESRCPEPGVSVLPAPEWTGLGRRSPGPGQVLRHRSKVALGPVALAGGDSCRLFWGWRQLCSVRPPLHSQINAVSCSCL